MRHLCTHVTPFKRYDRAKGKRRREFELIAVRDKKISKPYYRNASDVIVFQNKKKKRKRKEASRNTRISIESKYNIFLKFNIGINEFNIDRMSHISQLRTLCMSVPDRWIELERKRWERINKSEGKKSGVPITSLRWTMAESHLITIEFEFSSNR